MNQSEAKAILAELAASFPRQPLDEGQVVVWTDTLAPLPFTVARTAARNCRQGLDRMPTHRQFIETVRAEQRRLALAQPRPALPEPVSPVQAKANIARLRQQLGRLAQSFRLS